MNVSMNVSKARLLSVGRRRVIPMASWEESAGITCPGCGRDEYYCTRRARPAETRGPSCWHADCEVHNEWHQRTRGGTLSG